MNTSSVRLFLCINIVVTTLYADNFIHRCKIYGTWFQATKEERMEAKKTMMKDGALACGIIAIPVIGVILAKYLPGWLHKDTKSEVQIALDCVTIVKNKKGNLNGARVAVGNEFVLFGETKDDITLQITVNAKMLNLRNYPLVYDFAFALAEQEADKKKKISVILNNDSKNMKYKFQRRLKMFVVDSSSIVKKA